MKPLEEVEICFGLSESWAFVGVVDPSEVVGARRGRFICSWVNVRGGEISFSEVSTFLIRASYRPKKLLTTIFEKPTVVSASAVFWVLFVEVVGRVFSKGLFLVNKKVL